MDIEVEHYGARVTGCDRVRQWLERLKVIDERIRMREREIRRLQERRNNLVKAIGRGGSGGQRKDFSEVSDRLIDMEREIAVEIAEMQEVRQKIAGAIGVLPERLKLLMELRYIEGLRFDDIAAKMHYGRTTVWDMHTEALKIIAQMQKCEHH